MPPPRNVRNSMTKGYTQQRDLISIISEGGVLMGQPRIAAKEPSVMSLDPGTYYWCSCGRSRDQPFCDGSHEGTGFEPVELTVDAKKDVALCQCKHTKTPPFCDGTHQTL